jgi:hypothetical protein
MGGNIRVVIHRALYHNCNSFSHTAALPVVIVTKSEELFICWKSYYEVHREYLG